jgi:hypothetical protein
VKRVKIGLCSVAAASALALALAPSPAGAATASAARTGASPAPASPQPAVAPARGPAPAVTVKIGGPGSVGTDDNQDGACNSFANGDGDFCFWFSTNFVGSLSDFFFSDANLGNNTFLTPGLGLGAVVANNSESALNADSNLSVLVFTGTNFSGTAGIVRPRQFGNFNATFANNVESFEFF